MKLNLTLAGQGSDAEGLKKALVQALGPVEFDLQDPTYMRVRVLPTKVGQHWLTVGKKHGTPFDGIDEDGNLCFDVKKSSDVRMLKKDLIGRLGQVEFDEQDPTYLRVNPLPTKVGQHWLAFGKKFNTPFDGIDEDGNLCFEIQ